MDFSNLYKDTVTVEIVFPDGSLSGISVEVRPHSSDEVKAVDRAWQNKALRSKGEGINAEHIDRQIIDRIIAGVASWTWPEGAEFDGRVPDQSDSFKLYVFSHKGGRFIADQIARAMEDEAGFFVGLAKA